MKLYTVKVPVWGHYTVEVEAADEEEAQVLAEEQAFDDPIDTELDVAHSVGRGNVEYFPKPWSTKILRSEPLYDEDESDELYDLEVYDLD